MPTSVGVLSHSDVVQTDFSRDPPNGGHTALKGGRPDRHWIGLRFSGSWTMTWRTGLVRRLMSAVRIG
jgi:hypothetical protein